MLKFEGSGENLRIKDIGEFKGWELSRGSKQEEVVYSLGYSLSGLYDGGGGGRGNWKVVFFVLTVCEWEEKFVILIYEGFATTVINIYEENTNTKWYHFFK